MYSMVLVAAMTVAPATPDWGFKHGGCYGNGGGCYGYSCGGGCGGCGGGGWGFCGFGGGGWGGCHGGGWGCHGAATVSSGCCGGWGHPVAPYAGLAYSGCCGGHQPFYTGCSGYGNYVAPVGPAVGYGYGGGTVVVPAGGVGPTPGTVTPPTGGTTTPGTNGGKGGSSTTPGGISVPGTPEAVGYLPANRGQVVVRVPAEAKLFADGESTTLTGTERVFLTPELSAGRDFQYTLKVETESGSETRSVLVRGGHRTVVDFTTPGDKASSPVTVNLPAKAKLFVDGVAATAIGGTHTFRTPELARGKPFVYEFRAEIEQADGKTESVSKKVTFTAGEPVLVDFIEPAAVRTASK
jgi:uncharacterized protein (TIGR03000 family)